MNDAVRQSSIQESVEIYHSAADSSRYQSVCDFIDSTRQAAVGRVSSAGSMACGVSLGDSVDRVNACGDINYAPLLHSVLCSSSSQGGARRQPAWAHFDHSAWEALGVIVEETVTGSVVETAARLQGHGGPVSTSEVSEFVSYMVDALDITAVVDRFLSTDPASSSWSDLSAVAAESTQRVDKVDKDLESRLVDHIVTLVDEKCCFLFGSSYRINADSGPAACLSNDQSIAAHIYIAHNIKSLIFRWKRMARSGYTV